jgi:hypothetical protein
MKREYDG